MNGQLQLYDEDVCIFRGRIVKDAREFDNARRIEAEGLLACLNDSVIPPFNFPEDFQEDAAYQAAASTGNVVEFFLQWVLSQHSRQVSDYQFVQLGTVTVADPNNYISRSSSEYLTSMEVVKKKLVDLLGGYLVVDYSVVDPVLNYYADLPLTNIQKVEYGENLMDLVTETDGTQLYTAILPVGKDGLTIDSLPDGQLAPGFYKQGSIITSADTEYQYGGNRIIRKVDFEDVTLPENLQSKALTQLSTDGVKLVQTITVKAADLGGVDGLPRFKVGRYVELLSEPHGFSVAYPLMELEPDLFDPGNTTITMGATIKTSSDMANGNQNANQEQLDKIQIDLNNQNQQIINQTQETQMQITEAIQTSKEIVFSALEEYVKTSNYEEFKKAVSTQFEILAGEVNLKFTEVNEYVTNVDGDLQKTVETLVKHFEFGLDGLIIRAGEGAMTLTLDNDMILFKKNGQPFGWWDGIDFHTGNIVIDVTERAQFGTFAFVPRSNGSLSFLKVATTGVKVVTQPRGKTATVGASVTLSALAVGTGITYQWQRGLAVANSATTWTNISGATSPDYTFTARKYTVTSGGVTLTQRQYYRCIITDSSGATATTDEVEVVVT